MARFDVFENEGGAGYLLGSASRQNNMFVLLYMF
jgi:hypothetical protein